LKIALIFISLSYNFFPIETTIRNAPRVGKSDRKPYHHYGFRNPYRTINQENSSVFMNNICRKAKTKVETSSLGNLKIMPRNLNEIVLS
jgi:hypothetical protein